MRFLAAIIAIFVLMGGIAYGLLMITSGQEREVVAKKPVIAAPEQGPLSGAIADDVYETKVMRPLVFDETLVAPYNFGDKKLNLTQAVMKVGLDVVNPATEEDFVTLHKTVKGAVEAGRKVPGAEYSVLPSASMAYWKAREFDSGVIAALDLAVIFGRNDKKVGLADIVEQIFNKLEKTDYARTYLAAALELLGKKVELFPEEIGRRNIWLNQYKTRMRDVNPPIDYFTWNEELERVYDFETFLQEEIPRRQWFMAAQIAKVLAKPENDELRKNYDGVINTFDYIYRRRHVFTVDDLVNAKAFSDDQILEMFQKRPGWTYRLVFLTSALRREQLYFNEMLPLGLAPGLDPMTELSQRSKIGYVSFIPTNDRAGLEQVQAFALDALIAEPTGYEADKTLLSRVFKERLFHPYFATKQEVSDEAKVILPKPWEPSDKDKICPVFRVEPAPQFYLRTARVYDFMFRVSVALLGQQSITKVHRILPDGSESPDYLFDEINKMKRLFYGLYMVSCEDLGLRPALEASDVFERDVAYREALDWLKNITDDKDFARDARYISPGFYGHFADQNRQIQLIMTWANLGFRLMKFDSSFARAPQIREGGEGSVWNVVPDSELGHGRYVMPVSQFKMLDLVARAGIPPKQFREICDKANQDPDKIQEELRALTLNRTARVTPGVGEGGIAPPTGPPGAPPASAKPAAVPPPGKEAPKTP